MLGTYVCRQCLARLSRRAALTRNPQWQPRATFLSLRSSGPQHGTKSDQEKTEPVVQQQRPDIPKPIQDVPNIPVRKTNRVQTRSSRYSGLLDDNTTDNTFYADHEQEDTYQEAEPTEELDKQLVHAAPIYKALKEGQVQTAWDSFEQTYTAKDCAALTQPSFPGELEKQGLVFGKLLSAVTGAFCSNNQTVSVTPTAALFKYQQLGIARPGYWNRMGIGRLTHEVILAVNDPKPREPRPQQDLQVLLHELISLWRLFFQCMRPKSDRLESIKDDWSLPSLEELPHMHDSKDFNRRLQNYVPMYTIKPTFGFCALYLYSISDALEPTIRQTAAPFISFLERLIAGSRVDTIFLHTESSFELGRLPEKARRQIRHEIDVAPKKAMAAIGKVGESPDEMTNLEAFYNKRISRAAETMTSLKNLDELWKEVELTYLREKGAAGIPRSVYNNFLSGYLILHQSQRAVEVWNHMVAHKVEPDMKSWVALLEGCAKAKDLNGFNAMWQRMLDTGLEPDNYAWTTRVNGLMSLRVIKPALSALDEMGKRWLAGEEASKNSKSHGKGQKGAKQNFVNKCTKPSIEVINGAISAIVRIRPSSMRHEKRVDLIQKILAWAGNFQIKPDAMTYNSLIQLYLLGKDTGTALRLLSQMGKEGIEGDVATHTMLIKAAFENHVFDGQTEQQQTDEVLKMFDNLEASGLELNDYVYALTIDRLLKQYANYSGVRTIMEHMTQRGFVPSLHVYTSLITHYFQSEPPNVGEVDHIVNLLFTAPRMPSDRILYDRIIEGYASLGEVGKMMSVLTRMSRQGKMPGWGALIAVVRELARQGDVERARDVVRDVARGEGVAKQGIQGNREGENTFRHMVRVLGLGEEEGSMGGDGWARGSANGGSVVQRHIMVGEADLDSSAQHQQQQQELLNREHVQDRAVVEEEEVHGFLSRDNTSGEPYPKP